LRRRWIPLSAARGLGWDELIRRSLDAASAEERKRIYSGERTDHLDPAEAHSLDDAIRAYLEQIEAIQRLDGRIILTAGRALAQVAKLPRDYEIAYMRVLSARDRPAILHWLGDMFDGAQSIRQRWDTTRRRSAIYRQSGPL
jgi:hypothetical protein